MNQEIELSVSQDSPLRCCVASSSPSYSFEDSSQSTQISLPSSSQQNRCCVIRCTPNLLQKISSSQPITSEVSFLSEFEKKISLQFDKSMKKHYKRMKKKLKDINKRVIANQNSIKKLQEIIEESFDELIEDESIEMEKCEGLKKRKIAWRRSHWAKKLKHFIQNSFINRFDDFILKRIFPNLKKINYLMTETMF